MSQKLKGTAHLAALHQALWQYDPWYKRSWLIAPTIAGLALGGLLIAPRPPSSAPWGKPIAGAQQQQQQQPIAPPVKAPPSSPQSPSQPPQSAQPPQQAPSEPAKTSSATQTSHPSQTSSQAQSAVPPALLNDPRYRACITSPDTAQPRNTMEACSFVAQEPSAPAATRAEAYLNRGMARRQMGEPPGEAIKDYDEALKVLPTYVAALNNRGMEAINLGHHEDAVRDLSRAIEVAPHLAAPYYNRARAWNIRRDYDRAIADANEALQRRGTPPHTLLIRAFAYRMKGQLQQEMDDLNEIVRLHPKDAKVREERLLALMRRGDFAGVITAASDAIKDFPSAAEFPALRGEASFYLRRYDQAAADLQTALTSNPRHVSALIVRGRLHNHFGRYEAAIRDAEAAIAISRPFWAYDVRANALINLGNPSQATADIDVMNKINPNLPEVHHLYGLAAERQETQLIEHCTRVKSAPSSALEAATCARKLADYGVAITHYTKAISLAANSIPSVRVTHMVSRARVYRLNGQFNLAAQDLAQARSIEQSRWDVELEAGHLASALGDNRRAIQDYTRAIQIEPRSVLAHYSRARSYALLGERNLAIEGYKAALALDSRHELSRQGLAVLGVK